MKKRNIGIGPVIDLIELSDAFRRHAKYDDKKTVKKLVKETRAFAATLTNYYSEYDRPGSGSGMVTAFNREVIEALKIQLARIAQLAETLGAQEVILPLSHSKHSVDAQMVRSKVIKGLDLPVKASLQRKAYTKDLSGVGKIDSDRETVLDQGYRGFAAFGPKFFAIHLN